MFPLEVSVAELEIMGTHPDSELGLPPFFSLPVKFELERAISRSSIISEFCDFSPPPLLPGHRGLGAWEAFVAPGP